MQEITSYTLSPEEIEKMLSSKYGKKLEPVDTAKLAKQNNKKQKANLFTKLKPSRNSPAK